MAPPNIIHSVFDLRNPQSKLNMISYRFRGALVEEDSSFAFVDLLTQALSISI